MTTTNENEEILIKIGAALGAKAFSFHESFYQTEIRHAVELMRSLVGINTEKQRECGKGDQTDQLSGHYHNAISVLGKRGIGKTSFMLTLQRYIQDKEQALCDQLVFLRMIDPAMLEDAEYLLVTITSIICQYIDSHGHDFDHTDFPDPWKKALQDLCGSFIALHGPAYKKHMDQAFQYPEITGNYAIRNGCGGLMLAQKFNQFVNESIKIIRKKRGNSVQCFVLMIDDVDTVYHKSWIIMENIRKYLTTPQIIVIASGDTSLFELVIRNQLLISSRTSASALESELIKKQDLTQLKEIEWQYQLKIFPVVNRIYLPHPRTHLLRNIGRIKCQRVDKGGSHDTPTIPFEELFSHFIENAFHYPQGHAATQVKSTNLFTWIIPKSNRVLLQLLEKIILPFDKIDIPDTRDLISAYKYLVTVELEQEGLNTVLSEETEDDPFIDLFLILVNRKEPTNTSLLPAITNTEEYNRSILFLNTYFSDFFQRQPQTIFDLWFKLINPSHDALVLLKSRSEPNGKEKLLINDFFKYMALCENMADFCSVKLRKLHPSAHGTDYYRKGPGFLRLANDPNEALYMVEDPAKPESGLYSWLTLLRRSKSVTNPVPENPIPDWNAFLASADQTTLHILSLFTLSVSDVRGKHPFVDFQRGISIICEIVKQVFVEGEFRPDRLDIELTKWNAWHTYPEINTALDPSESRLWTAGIKEWMTSFDVGLMGSVKDWLMNFGKIRLENHPIELMENIWKKTCHDLVRLSEKYREVSHLAAGKFLNLCAITFLHAVLSEEMLFNDVGRGHAIIPTLSFAGDINTLSEKVHQIDNFDYYPLFNLWVHCPFINTLLSEDQINELTKKGNFDFQAFTYSLEWKSPKGSGLDPKLFKIDQSTAYPLLCALPPKPPYSFDELDQEEKNEKLNKNREMINSFLNGGE